MNIRTVCVSQPWQIQEILRGGGGGGGGGGRGPTTNSGQFVFSLPPHLPLTTRTIQLEDFRSKEQLESTHAHFWWGF